MGRAGAASGSGGRSPRGERVQKTSDGQLEAQHPERSARLWWETTCRQTPTKAGDRGVPRGEKEPVGEEAG